jgi:hypothetical protein
VRGSRWAFALRGLFADRALVLSAFFRRLAGSVAGGGDSHLRERGRAEHLARTAPARADDSGESAATVPVFDGAPDPSVDRRVQEIVRDAFSAATVAIYRSAESEPFSIRGRIAVFGFFDGLDRHARLLAGRWPASRGAAVEVVVPAPAARELRLRVGDLVSARSRLDGDNVVTARVVGIYRVERRPRPTGGAVRWPRAAHRGRS